MATPELLQACQREVDKLIAQEPGFGRAADDGLLSLTSVEYALKAAFLAGVAHQAKGLPGALKTERK